MTDPGPTPAKPRRKPSKPVRGRAPAVDGSAAGPRAQRPRVRGTEKRKRVIDAAAAIFARNGYHGIGTREIAETLGIKVASLYFHLDSKEEALAEICQHGIEQALHYLRDAAVESGDMASFIRCFFRHQREDFMQNSDYVAVYLRELRHLSDEAGHRIALLSREFRSELDQMFTRFAESGALHPALTPRAASFIMLGTIRYMSQLFTDGPIRNFDGIMADSVEALIRGLRA